MLAEDWEQILLVAATEQIVLSLVEGRLDVALFVANFDPLLYHIDGEIRYAELQTLEISGQKG